MFLQPQVRLGRAFISDKTLGQRLAGEAPEPNAVVLDLLDIRPENEQLPVKAASAAGRDDQELLNSVFRPQNGQYMTNRSKRFIYNAKRKSSHGAAYSAGNPPESDITWDEPIFINRGDCGRGLSGNSA
jgi:hypothetical protein